MSTYIAHLYHTTQPSRAGEVHNCFPTELPLTDSLVGTHFDPLFNLLHRQNFGRVHFKCYASFALPSDIKSKAGYPTLSNTKKTYNVMWAEIPSRNQETKVSPVDAMRGRVNGRLAC